MPNEPNTWAGPRRPPSTAQTRAPGAPARSRAPDGHRGEVAMSHLALLARDQVAQRHERPHRQHGDDAEDDQCGVGEEAHSGRLGFGLGLLERTNGIRAKQILSCELYRGRDAAALPVENTLDTLRLVEVQLLGERGRGALPIDE